ncbi:MAG: thioredoxin reductase, partial [Chloroflexia bacterium]|nr:thioredoxin reductase [Chloroflexia bacterium]
MAVKPVLMTVDDDPEVLRAVERDLRTHYGNRYSVMAADSGASALETLEQLTVRNRPVALFLVDQRMPRMTGVEFLEKAIEFFPDAKRVLLTAYADTDAAIRAINTARVDYYLMKPWDPPDERLYPVVDDLLDDWLAGYRPAFEGIRIVSHRWSARAHNLKDFLARNQIPYQVLDIETEQAQKLVEVAGTGVDKLPLVLFTDGSHMVDPEPMQVAAKQGIRTRAETEFYDLVIVGGGPAGLAAAVYGGSEGLRTLMIEREAPGGQAGTSSWIENYLGFPSGLSGADLTRRALTQAQRF